MKYKDIQFTTYINNEPIAILVWHSVRQYGTIQVVFSVNTLAPNGFSRLKKRVFKQLGQPAYFFHIEDYIDEYIGNESRILALIFDIDASKPIDLDMGMVSKGIEKARKWIDLFTNDGKNGIIDDNGIIDILNDGIVDHSNPNFNFELINDVWHVSIKD
jgi:hypothetical protein